ncbi:hypothetical protein L6164_006805 [Bauhinia variegata]|uniref:Uncharacterized protein n=1 Tax=Bauhinia variegata TaxID=167791 RepID=A0ACB9PVJ8_BAUVA|nr:hypothetical protein L6164_006805 [Bauhinia variegata]
MLNLINKKKQVKNSSKDEELLIERKRNEGGGASRVKMKEGKASRDLETIKSPGTHRMENHGEVLRFKLVENLGTEECNGKFWNFLGWQFDLATNSTPVESSKNSSQELDF